MSQSKSKEDFKRENFKKEIENHSERALELLNKAKALKQNQQLTKTITKSNSNSNIIPLESILKSLVNPNLGNSKFSIKEGIPIAGKLFRAKLNTHETLSHLNSLVLEEAGISSELEKHKILIAFGIRTLKSNNNNNNNNSETSSSKSNSNANSNINPANKRLKNALSKEPISKKRKLINDEILSKEYGNIKEPNLDDQDELKEYNFNEILNEKDLINRFFLINRAPILTVWTTIILEKLGFLRREALSLSYCYVNSTSTSRGISIGLINPLERENFNKIPLNQPHFELMGLKIPLMKLNKNNEWRGISKGEIINPDRSFDYMKKSMFQTLPFVFGCLTLLANSYSENGDNNNNNNNQDENIQSPDFLHSKAYELYTLFRPETNGEWGKKSEFYCSKALNLRYGIVKKEEENDDIKREDDVKKEEVKSIKKEEIEN